MRYKSFKGQNYEKLKSELLFSNELFTDPHFKCDNSSLYKFKPFKDTEIIWKRAIELCQNPKFIVNSINFTELGQGKLSNNWFISALSSLTNQTNLIKRIIPIDQSFEKGQYAGIFHFRFWFKGEWIDVVVDDYLPVDNNFNLIFCQNRFEKNEMFGPLLEKAYAKLNRYYEFLNLGYQINAFIDFSGGICESFKLKNVDEKFWNDIFFLYWFAEGLLTCSVNAKKNSEIDEYFEVNYAFNIIGMYEILNVNGEYKKFRDKLDIETNDSIKLLHLKNSMNYDDSLVNTFSSIDWSNVSGHIKMLLNQSDRNDGTFFITYQDLLKNFDILDVVYSSKKVFYGDFSKNKEIMKYQFKIPQKSKKTEMINLSENDLDQITDLLERKNSIICEKYKNKNQNNLPRVCLLYADFELNEDKLIEENLHLFFSLLKSKFEEPKNESNNVKVKISLLETNDVLKRLRNKGKYSLFSLGYYLYKVRPGAVPNEKNKYHKTDLEFIHKTIEVEGHKEHNFSHYLEPGNYVIIPLNYNPKFQLDCLVRVLVQRKNRISEIKTDFDVSEMLIESAAFNMQISDFHGGYSKSKVCTIL